VVRTQIQLTEEQAKGLRRLAQKEGVSVAEIIRRSVNGALREANVPSEDELWDRALKVVGIGRSGLHDISERHDDYLAEAYME
jgi:hypothetical protein